MNAPSFPEIAKAPAGAEIEFPELLDLSELAKSEPHPPIFIIPGWLPAGEVSLFGGDGGTGKSAIALMKAVCIASGHDFYGIKVQRRRVAFVSIEDGEGILHWRLRRICAWLGIDLASLDGWLTVFDASKVGAVLMNETRDGTELTHIYEWLREQITAQAIQVLVIDGASDAFGANENSRSAVRRFIRSLRRLIPADGACVILAHVDKFSARNPGTATGYSGSTAWNNSVRSRWYLRAEGESLLLEVQKSNYAPSGSQIRLSWNASAHVFVGELAMPVSKLEREFAESDERAAIFGLIVRAQNIDPIPAAASGSRTSHHVLCAMDGFPDSLKGNGGRRRTLALIEQLRAAGQVTAGSVKTANRNSREILRASVE